MIPVRCGRGSLHGDEELVCGWGEKQSILSIQWILSVNLSVSQAAL